MLTGLRFWWLSTRGHRLAVWKSPYIRWRFETYTGLPAQSVTPAHLVALFRAERRQLGRFRSWLVVMRRLSRSH